LVKVPCGEKMTERIDMAHRSKSPAVIAGTILSRFG